MSDRYGFSLHWAVSADQLLADKEFSCTSIDIQAAGAAPEGELLRVNVTAFGDAAAVDDLLAHLLRAIEPLIPRLREQFAIGHDTQDLGVVLAPIPGDAVGTDGCGLAGHGGVLADGADVDPLTLIARGLDVSAEQLRRDLARSPLSPPESGEAA